MAVPQDWIGLIGVGVGFLGTILTQWMATGAQRKIKRGGKSGVRKSGGLGGRPPRSTRPGFPAAYGFAAGAAAPKENGLRWESRGSPIYSAGLCSRAASHTPATRRVRLTVSSSSVLAFTPVSRVRRHIGSFEAAEFTHSQVHRNCYGPRAG